MYQFCLVVFLIIAVALITLIMLQQNQGNNSGGGMLSSRSLGDMLGSGGINDGVTCLIVILAILFFLFSLLLGNMNSKQNQKYMQGNVQNSQLQDK